PVLFTGMADAAGRASGEWIGLMRLSARGATLVREELARMADEGELAAADLPALLGRLARRDKVAVHYISGHWLDVDTLTDLAEARNFS
ncbi:MAG: hypothetical protein ACRYGC_08810, partial [Janthinobacterium lividum]